VPVRLLVEAGIGVGVLDVDRLARLGDVSRDPHADLDADLADLQPLGDLGPELVPFPVHEEQGAPVGLHDFGDLGQDQLEEAVQVALRGHSLAHLEERGELLHAGLEQLCLHDLILGQAGLGEWDAATA